MECFKKEKKIEKCSGGLSKIRSLRSQSQKTYGRRYFTKSKFYPLDADDIDSNTKIMEESIGKGWILTNEIFGLNDKTRPYAERWVKWANENINKAVSVLE